MPSSYEGRCDLERGAAARSWSGTATRRRPTSPSPIARWPTTRGGSAASSAPARRTPSAVLGRRRLRTLRELAARTTGRRGRSRTPAGPRRGPGRQPARPAVRPDLPARAPTARSARLAGATGLPEGSPARARVRRPGRAAGSAGRLAARGRSSSIGRGRDRGRAGRAGSGRLRVRRLAGAARVAPSCCPIAKSGPGPTGRVPRRRGQPPAGRSTTTTGGSSTCWPATSPPPSPTPAPTRRSGGGPRRWPSWTAPRPRSSPTSATSSARR